MKNYDFIVIGAGTAVSFALNAADKGYKTALIEEYYPGGTCLNRGCIPTKVMLQSAEVAEYIRRSAEYGITAELLNVDLNKIKSRVNDIIEFWRNKLYKSIEYSPNLDFYNCRTEFMGDRTVDAGDERIRGNRIVIAVGMRPYIPDIPGLNEVGYLTNRNVLNIDRIPGSIAVIGGGYIGMEFAHFFSALGSNVIIIETKEKLLNKIVPELSDKFNEMVEDKYRIYTGTTIDRFTLKNGMKQITCSDKNRSFNVSVDEILLAAGRISNADTLDLKKTGVLTDSKGFIKTDEYMKTGNSNIWAFGDCIGTPAFRHISGYQGELLSENLLNSKHKKTDYSIVPSAIFTSPEIATVGLSCSEAQTKFRNVVVKKLGYFGNAKGKAIGINGFCSVVIDMNTDKILGFHIIGPYASILIHEVLPVMTAGLSYKKIIDTIHVHPALSELIKWTFTEGK